MPPDLDACTSKRVALLKALAHPTRLWITQTLASGERCVCELQQLIGDDLSTVSKHLTLLRQAGVVTSAKRGLNVYYRITCDCFADFLGCTDRLCCAPANSPPPSARSLSSSIDL